MLVCVDVVQIDTVEVPHDAKAERSLLTEMIKIEPGDYSNKSEISVTFDDLVKKGEEAKDASNNDAFGSDGDDNFEMSSDGSSSETTMNSSDDSNGSREGSSVTDDLIKLTNTFSTWHVFQEKTTPGAGTGNEDENNIVAQSAEVQRAAAAAQEKERMFNMLVAQEEYLQAELISPTSAREIDTIMDELKAVRKERIRVGGSMLQKASAYLFGV
jgi:hypothetical protein